MHPWEQVSTPVLIIGAGAAGIRVAIELAQKGVDCLILGKRAHGDAHTRMAAGGVNASLGSLDPQDHWRLHAADTVREGHFICQPQAVELLARHAPARVRELQEWGCHFDLTEDGLINQRYFGAQTFRRTCFVGDVTGEAMLAALVNRARALGVCYRQNIFITRLIVRQGRAAGAVGIDLETGKPLAFGAAAVVLAAGGCTSIYQRGSSRRDENTGDAMALALRAGAVLRDMEFVQFHPTGMLHPEEMRGKLVTEAVRGEGGRLFNSRGERFMENYSPERLELDARDIVARAIYEEIHAGRATPAGGVWLDISHRDAAFIRQRLPEIYHKFHQIGIDITSEPMEVAPTAHYAMGGVKVDFQTGASTVPGLYAVGEATSGLHGANRLGGNSLAETIVFGQITGAHLAEETNTSEVAPASIELIQQNVDHLEKYLGRGGRFDPADLTEQLRAMLWKNAGIVRSGEGLAEGLRQLVELRQQAGDLKTGDDFTSPSVLWAINLDFMLDAAEALLKSAILRVESRGAHFRKDAQEIDPEWERNICCARQDGKLELWSEPLPPLPPDLRSTLADAPELIYHQLE